MEISEFELMRDVFVAAFGGEKRIARLLDSLHDSWAWDDDLSFVAERDGVLVGQALYTHAILDTPRRSQDVLVLSPVGVRPDLHGQGIGSAMVTASMAVLQDRQEPLVFLEGDPRYYARFGFRRAVDLGFVAPSPRIPQDSFMVTLLPQYQTWMSGALVYPDAFWRCDAVGPR